MKILKTYLPLIVGAIILFTAKTDNFEMPYLYITGIALVMFGLYNISRSVGSKSEIKEDDENQ